MITGKIEWKVDPFKNLDKVDKSIRNKIIRVALNKATVPTRDAIVSNAVTGVGNLKKSIKIKTKYYKGKSAWVAIVGSSSKFKRKRKGKEIRPSRYAGIVERGSKFQMARPYLQPAMKSHGVQFRRTMTEKINQQIDEILRGKG